MADFGVLGPLQVLVDDRPVTVGGPRQRRLLAALLMQPGRVVSLDRLVDAVFDGRPSDRAEATLRSYATRLRQSLAPLGRDVVVRDGTGYRLDVSREDVDALRFEQAVAQARRMAEYADMSGACGVLRGALQMWRGDAYEEFLDELWARPEAERLEEERRAAQELLLDLEMQDGGSAAVVGRLTHLLAAEPYREGLVARLMLAHYRNGRPVDALRVYADYRGRAAEELGIDPGPELVDLERRVLARDPELGSPPARSIRGYRLGERLGTGRFGTVYAATLPGVARDYAVRVYGAGFADDPRVVRAFESDARAVATIDHPALLPLYDAWREPGAAVLVMRRMTGGTLQDLLDAHALRPAAARQSLVRVAGAALALSRRGLTHGRIRPSSVLLDGSGTAYLAEPALGLPTPAGTSDAADLVELARACLLPAGRDAAEPWLRDMAEPPTLDVPTAVGRLLAGLQAAAPRPENPYVGLRSFDVGDADLFFGRDDLIRAILGRLDSTAPPRLVLLVGGSGSGKSSVVRAGVLPALARGQAAWTSTVMVPGTDPLRNLEQALARVRTRGVDLSGSPAERARALTDATLDESSTLLVIDQLEELFTLTPRTERDRFLDLVVGAVIAPGGHLHVVATIRADYFDRPLDHPRFAAVAGRCSLPVPALTPAELERTITGPAAGRVTLDDGLVADLVAATVDEPAALPALQFALHELAERGGSALHRADLAELGGVEGAIAQRAEQLYRSLEPHERELVRRIITRLVVVESNGEASRTRVARAELARLSDRPGDIEALVESWVAARLLVGDRRADTREPTVELAHETILDRWPRLRGWIDEDRERLLALARLEDAAQTWDELDRDPTALLRGSRLEQAEDLLRDSTRSSGLTLDFVAAGAARRAEEQQAAADEARRRERTSRRLRRQRWLLAAALALALAVGSLALDQRNPATRVAAEAQARAEAATAGLAAASAQAAQSDGALSLLLAAEAHRLSPSPATYQALVAAVAAPRPAPVAVYEGERRYRTVAVDPITGLVAARSDGGVVDLVDATTGMSVGGFQALGAGGLDLFDGVVVAANRGPTQGSLRQHVRGEASQVVELPQGVYSTDVEFNPSGDRIAVSDTTGVVTVYDPSSWSVTDTLLAPGAGQIEQVAWGEGGSLLHALDSRATLMTWDIGTPAPPSDMRPPEGSVDLNDGDGAWVVDEPLRRETGFAFSELEALPSSPILLVSALDTSPSVLDLRDPVGGGGILYRDQDTVARPSRVDASARGNHAFTADGSSWAAFTDATAWADPGARKAWTAAFVVDHDAADIAVLPSGEVVTAGSDGNVTRWTVPTQVPGTAPVTELDGSTGVTFSPDGDLLVHWGPGSGATLSDAASYRTIRPIPLRGGVDAKVLGATFQPERGRVLIASCPQPPPNAYSTCRGELAAFDATTGALVAGPVALGDQRAGPGIPVAVVGTAELVATADATGSVTLRDPASLDAVGTLDGTVSGRPGTQHISLQVSPDGARLLVAALGWSWAAVWDMAADPPVLVHEDDDTRAAAFSPDGSLIVTTRAVGGAVDATIVLEPEAFSVVQEGPRSAGLLLPSATGAGDLMVTGDSEGTVWLWNGTAPRPLTTIGGSSAVLRPDGGALLLWRDGRAYELSLDEDHLLATACAAAGRNLTEQEWNRYLGPDEPYRQTCPGQPTTVT